MRVISVYTFSSMKTSPEELVERLNELNENEWWIKARYNKYWNEITGIFNYYITINDIIERFIPELTKHVTEFSNKKIRKSVRFFIDMEKRMVEIYRGHDKVTEQIKCLIEQTIRAKLEPLTLTPEQMIKIIKNNSSELTQAYFTNVDGFMYEAYRGRHLETNLSFLLKLRKYLNSLKIISVKPKILYESLYPYQITINGNKGTIKFSGNNNKSKPRSEIRQIIYIISNALRSG